MVADSSALVVAHGLTKVYAGAPPLTAVAGIDFVVQRGEVFGFLGPNGAGKSSTMRMIGCVTPPSGGELTILGRNAARDRRAIKARIGSVPQDDTLDTELTVEENVLIYGRYFGIPRAVIRERTSRLLNFVRLSDKRAARVQDLSGGMRRRLTIARSLVNEPDLLLLDEPTTGLDPQARHLLWERLFQLKQDGVTLILTTHYMDEAEQLCDRLAVMDGGLIVAHGSPAELIERYVSREVLELRFPADTRDSSAEKAQGVGDRVETLPDRLLCYSSDGEATLDEVRRRGLDPMTALVRRSGLEDVFLHLTGRTLVE